MEKSARPDHGIKEIQWRAEPAQTFLPRITPLLPRLQAAPPLDISFTDVLGIPIYLTVRAADLHSIPFHNLKEWGQLDFFYTHQGKGLTPEQSQVSCLMETIERYSAGRQPDQSRIRVAAYAELGREAVNPASFFLPPGIEFTPEKTLTWYEGLDLIQNKTILVPVDLALINLPDSAFPFEGFQTRRLGFFLSNGLSAGANLREALVSGICEVVERDAQDRVIKGLPPRPTELDLKEDPHFSHWVKVFEDRRLTLRAFFLKHKPGLYTAFAVSWDPYCRLLAIGSAGAPALGFALQQAMLEVAQQRAFTFFKQWKTSRPYVPIVRYIQDRFPPERYRPSVPETFWTEQGDGPVSLAEAGPDYSWDLEDIVAALSPEHQVMGLDLSCPEIGVPVVRVMISGLKNGYLDWRTCLGFTDDG